MPEGPFILVGLLGVMRFASFYNKNRTIVQDTKYIRFIIITVKLQPSSLMTKIYNYLCSSNVNSIVVEKKLWYPFIGIILQQKAKDIRDQSYKRGEKNQSNWIWKGSKQIVIRKKSNAQKR